MVWQDFCFSFYMKMSANIPQSDLKVANNKQTFQEQLQKIISTKWHLKSILETGIVTDEAAFNDVEIVFSQYHIYALYGNRVDKFKYKFLSLKTFLVVIEGENVKCRIKELNDDRFVFHADFRNSHFILELEAV